MMYSLVLLLSVATVSLVAGADDKIIFPDSFKKASASSSKGEFTAPEKIATPETKPRSFFGPGFGPFGSHDGLNHPEGPLPFGAPENSDSFHPFGGGGGFDEGPHAPGGFGGPGFNVPPPHGPLGSHLSGLISAGPHSPLSSFSSGGSHAQHIGPVIPVIDPLSANLGGNPVGFPVSEGCRFWCRTPKGQVYCCEDANAPQNPVVVKPGSCPASRPVCPPTRSFGPPSPCSNDGSCIGVDKCCFDTCLQEHTCKPPQGFGR